MLFYRGTAQVPFLGCRELAYPPQRCSFLTDPPPHGLLPAHHLPASPAAFTRRGVTKRDLTMLPYPGLMDTHGDQIQSRLPRETQRAAEKPTHRDG